MQCVAGLKCKSKGDMDFYMGELRVEWWVKRVLYDRSFALSLAVYWTRSQPRSEPNGFHNKARLLLTNAVAFVFNTTAAGALQHKSAPVNVLQMVSAMAPCLLKAIMIQWQIEFALHQYFVWMMRHAKRSSFERTDTRMCKCWRLTSASVKAIH